MKLFDILARGSLHKDMSRKVLARSSNNEYPDSAGATTWPTYGQGNLDRVLPVYGADFADWRRDRLVPEAMASFCTGDESSRVAGSLEFGDSALPSVNVGCVVDDDVTVLCAR